MTMLSIDETMAALSGDTLNTNQIGDILGNPQEFPAGLVEKLSSEVALRYWKRQVGYAEASNIINSLYAFWIDNNYFVTTYPFTDVAWECYEAFDAAEYYRDNVDRNVSIEEKYVRPLIQELLKKHRMID